MNFINTFLFYPIIGHFIENSVYTKIDSGILYGYWTPIYGVGVMIILFINFLVCRKVKNRFIRPIVLFFSCALILGILELMGGIIIEKLFGRIFWDYSNSSFCIFRYTSLKMMGVWGISSVLFIYVINPYLNLIIKKIPKSLTLTLAFLFVFDLIYTLITISN